MSYLRPTSDWNPALYMKFEDERTRAALDLLARVPDRSPREIVDLGCGPGNSTELLARRFPNAHVVGLDTSEAMLAHARRRVPSAEFVRQDIADWRPSAPPDLIFANAALHFLPDHHELFPQLAAWLPTGGQLAVQMPDNVREASHAAMRLVAVEGPWADRLGPIAKSRPVIAGFEDYYGWLRPLCAQIDVWMTTYVHPLEGAQGIADWFAGSGLRPFLDPLDVAEREDFLVRYRRELAEAYPLQTDGAALLAYPRLFLVATRG